MAVVLEKIIERLNKCDVEIPIVLRDPDGIVSELIYELKEHDWRFIHLSDISEEFIAMLEAERLVQQGCKVLVYIGNISDKSLVHLAEYWDRGNGLNITAANLLSEIGISPSSYNKRTNISIVKIGLKKDEKWWGKVKEKRLAAVLKEVEEGLLAFLEDPESLEITQEQKSLLFEHVLKEHFGMEVPHETPLKEVSRKFGEFILEKFFLDNPSERVAEFYERWEDSKTYEKSLISFAKDFEELRKDELLKNIDKLKDRPNHPFIQVENELFLKKVEEFLQKENKTKVLNFVKERAKKRNRKALEYIDEFSWKDFAKLEILLNKPDFSRIEALDDLIELYTGNVWKFDRLWRELENLDLPSKLKDFAKEEIRKILLETENFWENYYSPEKIETNQAGLIRRILEKEGRIAVIVVDAMRFELAKSLDIGSGAMVNVKPIIAVTPTETHVGMGALFSSGAIEKRLDKEKNIVVVYDKQSNREIITPKDREENLKNFIEDVQFLELDKYSMVSSEKVVLKSQEIDKLGHSNFVRFFSQIVEKLKEAVIKLIQSGYEVHIISDHGFYLADMESKVKGVRETAFNSTSRYKFSSERPDSSEKVVVERIGDTYVSYALGSIVFNDRAGIFLHGGVSLQEVLVPHVIVTLSKGRIKMGVKIKNKEDLRIVQRNTFDLVLESENRMFGEPNRVYLEVGKKKIEVENVIEGEVKLKVVIEAKENEVVRISVRDKDNGKLLDYVDVKFLPSRRLLF